MSIIFFGDVDESIGFKAKALSSDAVLIDHQNYSETLRNKNLPPVSYTSLGDLPDNLVIIYSLLDLASEIIYCPPMSWSDKKTINNLCLTNSINGLTEHILFNFHKTKQNVRNFALSFTPNQAMLDLADHRKSELSQLWIAGCSISHGVGVEKNQRYGAILADILKMPVSFLTSAGSSVEWAADQILRSDLRSGDLVIWGLTSDQRVPWFDVINDRIVSITAATVDKFPELKKTFIDILESETRIYKSLISVHQVINFCRKIQSKLLILGLLESDSITMNLAELSEFEPIVYLRHHNRYLDLGTDNEHPGPKQHEYYSKFCLQELSNRNLI